MRTIDHIVLHCTATPQNTTVESIQKYWRTPPPNGNGWKSPGYHHIIKADGTVVDLLPIDQVSNGVGGHNAHSIHISYIGGVDKNGKAIDNRTDAQKTSQISLLKKYHAMFPAAVICGHRDFPGVTKECPSFDVATWLKEIDFYGTQKV
jgi:N-acetylmuramoyl-L-alanine amidase